MQPGREDPIEPFELFLPDDPPEEIQDEPSSGPCSFDAIPPRDACGVASVPDLKNAKHLVGQLPGWLAQRGRNGTERSPIGKSNRAIPGKKEDVTLRPLVRNRQPCEGEAPLSAVIVDDDARFGYRIGWVIVTLKITNRCKRDLRFTCRGIRLTWDEVTTDLVPPDLSAWTVQAQRKAKVSTLAPIMVNRRALEPASPFADVRLDLFCDTTKQCFPVDIREAVWPSHLRPAFFDETSVVLVCPPGAQARKEERAHVAAQY